MIDNNLIEIFKNLGVVIGFLLSCFALVAVIQAARAHAHKAKSDEENRISDQTIKDYEAAVKSRDTRIKDLENDIKLLTEKHAGEIRLAEEKHKSLEEKVRVLQDTITGKQELNEIKSILTKFAVLLGPDGMLNQFASADEIQEKKLNETLLKLNILLKAHSMKGKVEKVQPKR